jgi:electron transfer flavoprotein alpha subunit
LTGGPEHEPLLRSAAACADGLFRLDGAGHSATDIAEAVRELEHSAGYDLIVTGSTTLEDNRSLDAFLAGRLKRSHAAVDLIRLKSEHAGVPVLIGVTKASAAAESDIGSLVEASARGVTVLRPGAESKAKTPPLFVRPMAAAAAVKTMTTVRDAADYLKEYAAALSSGAAPDYGGAVPEGELYSGPAVWAVLDPINQKENLSALRASRIAADLFGKKACALVVAPGKIWPSLIGLAKANGADTAYCVDTRGALTEEGRRLVTGLVADASGTPAVIAGKHWSSALAFVAGGLTAGKNGPQLAARITGITKDPEGYLLVSSPVYDGKLIRREPVRDGAAFLTVSEEAELPTPGERGAFEAFSVSMDLKPDWTVPLPPPAEPALSQAEVIIDLGYGIRDKSGMELATELRKKLEALGLAPLFGATRKVTQDLKLLPLETQIGQTGVRVNPKLIIALGISGAPQHIDWLGTRAEILCFNKDPEAPLVKLNQTRPAPRVHPIPGDLFVTVRELIEKLG